MTQEWTTLRVLQWTTGRFTKAGIETARLEAQVLLAHALQCDRVALYMQYDKPLVESELTAYHALIRRRLDGEPVAYLTGEQEFWSLPFHVDKRVLIPRRDTETVIELVRDETQRNTAVRIADIATGSGVLAITLLHELPNSTAIATDTSDEALAVAKQNAERNEVAARIDLRQGDLLAALGNADQVDVLVSNPPYIASADIDGLSAEVRHEPRIALDGGDDGLHALRAIIAAAHKHIASGGLLVLEHGHDQADAVRDLIDASGSFKSVQTRNDLAGNPRVTWARRAQS